MATAHPIPVAQPKPGEVLLKHGLASAALPHLLAYTRSEPACWHHYLNLAIAYRYLGRFDDARTALVSAAQLDPDAWPVYHTGANLAEDLGDFPRALDLRWKACGLCGFNRREVALGLAISLLRDGQWQKGWPYWELGRFLYSWTPPPHVKPWKGESLDGKRLLVMSEGGYGDVFQFARWLPLLAARGASLTLYVYPRQIDLLKRSPNLASVEFLPLGTELPPSLYHYATSILSVPALLSSLPGAVPPTLTFSLDTALPSHHPRPRWGLCWQAEENGSIRKTRGIPGRLLECFQVKDVEWYSLVPGTALPWMHPGPDNWVDTARLIRGLDGVVSCDTAAAHLAGCLGIPTLLLLPVNAEWRWGTGTTGQPWYSRHTLIRARQPDRWQDALDEAVRLLNG